MVGMTTTIGASLRAYQLGDEFRRRGIPVVMGGFHATLQPAEALKHADAVVQGEADLVWAPLLQDWRDGKLKQTYKSDKLHDLKNLPRPRHELLKLNRYMFKAVPIQASASQEGNDEYNLAASVTQRFYVAKGHRKPHKV